MVNTLNLADYSRQETMDRVLGEGLGSKSETKQCIIGCGGIGFWLGLILAMLGFKDFILIDGDVIDNTNLARLPVPQTWIGVNKAVALRKLIRQLRPDAVVTVFNSHATSNTLVTISSLVESYTRSNIWDTTDDARIQREICEATSRIDRAKYRKIGYEGWKVGNYKDTINVWGVDENYQPGYRTTSANALSSILASCIGILSHALDGDDTTIDFMELLGKESTNE